MDENLNECSYRIHPGTFKPIKLTLEQADQGLVQKLAKILQILINSSEPKSVNCEKVRLYVRDERRIMGPFCNRSRPKRSIQNYAPNVVEQSIEQLSNSTFYGDEIDLIVVKDDLS